MSGFAEPSLAIQFKTLILSVIVYFSFFNSFMNEFSPVSPAAYPFILLCLDLSVEHRYSNTFGYQKTEAEQVPYI